MAASLDGIFEVGPAFRAQPDATSRWPEAHEILAGRVAERTGHEFVPPFFVRFLPVGVGNRTQNGGDNVVVSHLEAALECAAVEVEPFLEGGMPSTCGQVEVNLDVGVALRER